ncbi:MAG: hypothetical protein PHX44_07220 [Sulfurimonas sp.]|uniref:hypothetical protein n=1 Tax=Sulfurimonas sp. TaxID=2022749 RepID=UPI00260691F8|nr:hypothetical protein [Sulfurimonas sp.]MDD2652823.1 hypothetical protein [Sulfurimonas sp.]MDD3450868.1 hypothetical protein [Sulfurimonas sp.]
MMNDANEISHHTMLYGFIGESAGQSSFSATLNKLFKANNKNAMMIPMNIREDDFYYTLVNMKKSHVNGALLAREYTKSIIEILDDASDRVKLSGVCDIVVRDGQKLFGDVIFASVLADVLKKRGAKKIALLGVNGYAKAFCLAAEGFEISYFYDDLEALMQFVVQMQRENADINRIASGMQVNLASYDAVIDFSDFESLDMVCSLSAVNLDINGKKEPSVLRTRAGELGVSYKGFDDVLEETAQEVFEFLKMQKHLEHDKSDMKF